jgi:hypothetical protein
MRRLDASTDGQALRSLCALNLGPHGCLRAVGGESEPVDREGGSEAPHICTDCGPNIDVVCEPIAYCLQAVTTIHRRL